MDIKHEFRQWIKGYNWHIAGTLTYKAGTTEIQAERIMRNFWGRANQGVYGNAWRRFEKRIENVTILDTNSKGKNPHYHIIIKLPDDRFDRVEAFCSYLRQHWRDTSKGNYIFEFEAIENEEGWINYITRKITNNNTNILHSHSSHVAQKRSQTD